MWYAVQMTKEDPWDNGSHDLSEAKAMLKAQGCGLIAVIDNDFCIEEIPYEEEEKKMTYTEYKKARQDEFNALPIFWAFSNAQFDKALEERGVTDLKQVVRISTGGFCLKKDLPEVKAFIEKPDPLKELMKDPAFAEEAIYYEMMNHEYGINWEGDYDVCSCFGHIEYTEEGNELQQYFDQLGWGSDTRRAYLAARSRYNRDCGELF